MPHRPVANKPFIRNHLAAGGPITLIEASSSAGTRAFTGAERKQRQGKFKLADGRHRWSSMSRATCRLCCRPKLLRALQEQEIEAARSNEVVKIDVRVIAATSPRLAGWFRRALSSRLTQCVRSVHVQRRCVSMAGE